MSGMSPITSTTGEINITERRGPRTEPCRMPVNEVSKEEDDESILTKDEDLISMSESRCGQFLTNRTDWVKGHTISVSYIYICDTA